MTTTALPHRLDRTILIQAAPQTVFSFFTESDRWASWWGAGSTIDAKRGGQVYIRHPNGIETAGEVIEVHAPERIVFTYGFTSGTPIPPGSSRVTIRLEPVGGATRLHLLHEFAETSVRDEHVQGWRYQLSLFGNAVADLVNARAAEFVDAWFSVWSETDAAARERTLSRIAGTDVGFRDRFSLLDGIADVVAHIGATQRFMPGMHLKRRGDVRHCQGTLLVDWAAVGDDGQERASGTNVFTMRADGLIESAVGFWALPKK
jgi:uncharacterized protein YndB with AHSA1/START domain